ncbi:aminopeptidase [Paenibacillus radicis (ex Gao et al. 2016)]|uniref:Aminopeptidase n=1 Tax=Paenibacillus radicis (ex Gao et al. 2016) TaxID=1737354 RepID=A0A917HAC4_9BACL|nr:aminopeptidase [Paenibacillus radicis (ex Gao et al. 2016)]GGG72475.1 aminopeptidase [Paenibacillus radicis (ex Gao et al. 2016)]
MKDSRIEQLARNVVAYSVSLQKGEKLLIEVEGHDNVLAQAIVREAYRAEAYPFVVFTDQSILRTQLMHSSLEQLERLAAYDFVRMDDMDAYVLIRANENGSELSDIAPEKLDQYWKVYYHHVHEPRWAKTKWCILSYPSAAAAQLAKMPTEAFEDLYFNVCNLDYSHLSQQMDALVSLLSRTDKVRITGNGTDLTMSIKGMPVRKDAGLQNLPDGEVYSVPIKHSINGCISFNTPVHFRGTLFDDIVLTFEHGQIIDATANDTAKLLEILEVDEGARYIGEFGIGLNPYIEKPVGDILFDEKIWGSIHLAIGSAAVQADNSNLSSIHWDIVCNQREEYGGGQLWFDDVLIRENGYFVIAELETLNPEKIRGFN